MARLNLDHAELEPIGGPEPYGAREARIGPAIGGEHLAGNLLDIPPGRRAWPYHWEAAQEEWLVVLAGTPTVRTPAGEEALAPGDVVCFPPGPDGAHQVRNDGAEPCRVVMLSSAPPVNVTAYPDSGKVGFTTRWLDGTLPQAAEVDYWSGE